MWIIRALLTYHSLKKEIEYLKANMMINISEQLFKDIVTHAHMAGQHNANQCDASYYEAEEHWQKQVKSNLSIAISNKCYSPSRFGFRNQRPVMEKAKNVTKSLKNVPQKDKTVLIYGIKWKINNETQTFYLGDVEYLLIGNKKGNCYIGYCKSTKENPVIKDVYNIVCLNKSL